MSENSKEKKPYKLIKGKGTGNVALYPEFKLPEAKAIQYALVENNTEDLLKNLTVDGVSSPEESLEFTNIQIEQYLAQIGAVTAIDSNLSGYLWKSASDIEELFRILGRTSEREKDYYLTQRMGLLFKHLTSAHNTITIEDLNCILSEKGIQLPHPLVSFCILRKANKSSLWPKFLINYESTKKVIQAEIALLQTNPGGYKLPVKSIRLLRLLA